MVNVSEDFLEDQPAFGRAVRNLRRSQDRRSDVSGIIPGDWEKGRVRLVGSAPLCRTARKRRGGRIHQFLWRCSRAVSNAKEELRGEGR
jgi:hypothetical protein